MDFYSSITLMLARNNPTNKIPKMTKTKTKTKRNKKKKIAKINKAKMTNNETIKSARPFFCVYIFVISFGLFYLDNFSHTKCFLLVSWLQMIIL